MRDVFITYAEQDADAARRLAGVLEARGWSSFWDRTIPPDKSWSEIVGAELTAASCQIVIWSRDSVNSIWVLEEARHGLNRGVLIGVYADDIVPPPGFSGSVTAGLLEWNGDRLAAGCKLVARITDMIGPAPAPAEEPAPPAPRSRDTAAAGANRPATGSSAPPRMTVEPADRAIRPAARPAGERAASKLAGALAKTASKFRREPARKAPKAASKRSGKPPKAAPEVKPKPVEKAPKAASKRIAKPPKTAPEVKPKPAQKAPKAASKPNGKPLKAAPEVKPKPVEKAPKAASKRIAKPPKAAPEVKPEPPKKAPKAASKRSAKPPKAAPEVKPKPAEKAPRAASTRNGKPSDPDRAGAGRSGKPPAPPPPLAPSKSAPPRPPSDAGRRRRAGTRRSSARPALKTPTEIGPFRPFRPKRRIDEPDLVVVPPGTLRLSDDVLKIVKSFAIGRYPVTFDEYDRFARDTGRALPSDRGWGRGRRPVINLQWEGALAYTRWLSSEIGKSFRLPTRAEWKYVAGVDRNVYERSGSASEPDLDDDEWYWPKYGVMTHPVDALRANDLGVYDLQGNVWEWVAATDPGSETEESAALCLSLDKRLDFIGFRLACDLD